MTQSSTRQPVNSMADAKAVSRLERELEATLERYELIWKATHDILYDLNIPDGTIIWNEALYEQFGYPKHEPTGTLEWWATHIHPDDALNVEQRLHDWLSGDQNTWRSEYRFRKANGTYSYVLDRGTVIRDNTNAPLRIIGTLFDITHQKELERAKDEFISLVSHQLRTPLTVIRVYSEMFANGLLGPITDTQATHIARMTDASIRLIKLVDDILNLSRLEMGSYEMEREWTDLNELLGRSLEDVKPLADTKQVTVSFIASPHLPQACLDREIVSQIIANLLVNAIRYTRSGQGRVEVSCHTRNDEAIITVKDNGIGIPKTDQKHIFERFYRARNAVNIEEQGTGLGLYIVQVLAKTLGGRVWFESSRGKGATFYLALPLQ